MRGGKNMITDKEAFEAYNRIRKYCLERKCEACIFQGAEDSCYGCLLDSFAQSRPDRWQELEIE